MTNNYISDITAILLCGGKGERLRPFTESLPKALVPLSGEPLLAHLLRYLSAMGVTRSVVCVGYKSEAIKSFLSEFKMPEMKIECVDSGDVSMTDRILDATQYVPGRGLICYGDTLANVDLGKLVETHRQSGGLATLTTYPLRSPFGIVHFDQSKRISAFDEKPWLPYSINIGFMLCEPSAFGLLRRNSDMPEFLSVLAEANALYAYEHTGKHLTVNTEKERAEAETEVIEFFTIMDGQNK